MGRHRTDGEYLSALASLEAQLGLPPTLRELADELGMSSAPAVLTRLRDLSVTGYVERRAEGRYVSRMWRLTTKGKQALT